MDEETCRAFTKVFRRHYFKIGMMLGLTTRELNDDVCRNHELNHRLSKVMALARKTLPFEPPPLCVRLAHGMESSGLLGKYRDFLDSRKLTIFLRPADGEDDEEIALEEMFSGRREHLIEADLFVASQMYADKFAYAMIETAFMEQYPRQRFTFFRSGNVSTSPRAWANRVHEIFCMVYNEVGKIEMPQALFHLIKAAGLSVEDYRNMVHAHKLLSLYGDGRNWQLGYGEYWPSDRRLEKWQERRKIFKEERAAKVRPY